MLACERVRTCQGRARMIAAGQFWGGEYPLSARAGCLNPVVGSAMMLTIKAHCINIRPLRTASRRSYLNPVPAEL
jgi:hypothetical protein